jgi:hypothetical protein
MRPDDFHFHALDIGPDPWTLSGTLPHIGNLRFYSMLPDLAGLAQFGQDKKVPEISTSRIGFGEDSDRNLLPIPILSFGPKDAPAIVITGGIHAREWISCEIAYLIAEYLLLNFTTEPSSNEFEKAIRYLVENRRIHVLPILNPCGHTYTIFSQDSGARLWRRNRRQLPLDGPSWVHALNHAPFTNVFTTAEVGFYKYNTVTYTIPGYPNPPAPPPPRGNKTYSFRVPPFGKNKPAPQGIGADLNRNFPTAAWGQWASETNFIPMPASDDYFGTDGASEPETKAIAAFLRSISDTLKATVDYHSYAQLTLYPSEAFNSGRVTEKYERMGQVLSFQTGYRLGTAPELLGYDGIASLADFASAFDGVRSFTIELDPSSAVDDGFTLPEDQIQMVFEKNILGALCLMAVAGGEPEAALPFVSWNVTGRGNRLPLPE